MNHQQGNARSATATRARVSAPGEGRGRPARRRATFAGAGTLARLSGAAVVASIVGGMLVTAPLPAAAQVLAPKDVQPYRNPVYNITFSYPRKDWLTMPAAGGNIALLMQRKGEASVALDYQVLRIALAPDEIDDTFKGIELEALTQRVPNARVASSELKELGGNKAVLIKYATGGPAGELDVTQYTIVSGASLYRLTCATTRATVARHAPVCETVATSLAIGK